MRWQTIYEARWIFTVLIALGAGSYFIHPRLVWVWVAFILYTFYFFRDPERPIPGGDSVVVAPADGVVADIEEVDEPEFLKDKRLRVGIFLSVFDVHTNRAPIPGKVVYTEAKNGKYLDARHPKASELNAYRTWAIENPRVTVVIRQITGAIARRIVAWSKPGDELAKGDHFGMIRFGSRTEIYLPIGTELKVKKGDRVKCGSTIIAQLQE